jgi:glycerophosphoryl diester phosphodiesterase
MVEHGEAEATVLAMAGRPAATPQNPWLARRVIAYAHQGGAWEGPSSTLHTIAAALEAGATGIELDVHATRDGHLVVCHDATVDRTTDGHGAIASLTLAEIRRLDNAHWWAPGADVTPGLPPDQYPFRGRAPADRNFGVATLEEVLESFPGVVLNLDIKQTAPAVEPYEARLATMLHRFGRTDDVIVASFLDAATDAFSAHAPDVPTSAGTLAVADFYRSVRAGEEPAQMRHVALQVPTKVGDLTVVDETFVAAAHAAGLAVHVWTIEEEDEMERLGRLGVDGIVTDRPSALVRVLDGLGCSWHPGHHRPVTTVR